MDFHYLLTTGPSGHASLSAPKFVYTEISLLLPHFLSSVKFQFNAQPHDLKGRDETGRYGAIVIKWTLGG